MLYVNLAHIFHFFCFHLASKIHIFLVVACDWDKYIKYLDLVRVEIVNHSNVSLLFVRSLYLYGKWFVPKHFDCKYYSGECLSLTTQWRVTLSNFNRKHITICYIMLFHDKLTISLLILSQYITIYLPK